MVHRAILPLSLLVFFASAQTLEAQIETNSVLIGEYNAVFAGWKEQREHVIRAMDRANSAANRIKMLLRSDPTCEQFEKISTFPFRNALAAAKAAFQATLRLVRLEERAGRRDQVRALESMMANLSQDESEIYAYLKHIILLRAEVCGGGKDA